MEQAGVLLGHLEAHDIHDAVAVRKRQRARAALAGIPEARSWMDRGAGLDGDQLVTYALHHLEHGAFALVDADR